MKKKKVTKIVLTVIICLFLACGVFKFVLSNVNYSLNIKQEFPTEYGYINKQNKLTNLRFGIHSANKNSCGAIATYNFLKLNNKEKDFYQIMKYYDVFGTVAFGALGVNPFAIQSYLRQNGFKAKISLNTKKFETLAKQSKTSILFYFHKSGAHYVTFDYNQTTDKFIVYNYYSVAGSIGIDKLLSTKPNNGIIPVLIYI